MTAALDRVDAAIVNAFQGGFPVCEEPFAVAADALSARGVDVSADELVDRIAAMEDAGTISRFGPLVDAEAIGGTATLVATHAPEDRFDAVVEAINDRQEVAHNYERDHDHLNVWFVVSVADPDRVETVLAEIEAATGQPTYNLPKIQEFHVGAKFPVEGPLADVDGGLSLIDRGPDAAPADTANGLTPAERDLVVAVQGGLDVTSDPYAAVAEEVRERQGDDRAAASIDAAWVRERITAFRDGGQIRRVGVVPNHYALGYSENGMTVWDVPDDVVDEVGPAIADFDFVTHCYERPRHEGVWPYNVFAMTHGRDEAESDRRIEQVRERMDDYWSVDEDDWATLFSTQILKKTGIRLADRADEQVRDDAEGPGASTANEGTGGSTPDEDPGASTADEGPSA